jgi:hypothetical protein
MSGFKKKTNKYTKETQIAENFGMVENITSFILSVTKKGPCQGLCNLGFNPFFRRGL